MLPLSAGDLDDPTQFVHVENGTFEKPSQYLLEMFVAVLL